MERIQLPLKAYEKIRLRLFYASVIYFKDLGTSESQSVENEKRIGVELNKMNQCISKSIFGNIRDIIAKAEKREKNSAGIKIDRAIAIKIFFQEVIKSGCLKGREELVTEEQLLSSISELSDTNSSKAEIPSFRQRKSDPLPNQLFGVYRGYFIRPLKEKPVNHIAMLVICINRQSEVEVRSTKEIVYNTGTTFYQRERNLIVCKFEGTNKSATHIFQFSLKHEEAFSATVVLKGIYGGTDPKETLPICGKIIFEKVDAVGLDLETLYKQTTPTDFITEASIANLFIEKQNVFNFLKSNDYIEDTNFFKNYSITHDLLEMKVAGVYSIYSLYSNEFQISIGIIRIDRLGTVEIKGKDKAIYKGSAKVFGGSILSIDVFEKTIKGKPSVDYYFNYLMKIKWGEDQELGHPFFHGIRTIVAEHLEIPRPSAARVIFKREEERNYDELEYKRVNILPYEWNKQLKKVLSYSKMKSRKLFNETNDSFVRDAVNYLIGDANNLLIAKSTKEDEFKKIENYALLYFNAAINHANKEEESEAKFNFDRAFTHGFHGSDYLRILEAEKEKPYLTPKAKDILKKIDSHIINGEPYFFFGSGENK
ncbi:MAG TPA: hypothetical protein PLN13_13550 [Bacteroidia bacterium]|nr:hypothetical protein [Bacteroidia bacterium]HRH09601.1 hypothetical protein [Bacteroidia bacterium]